MLLYTTLFTLNTTAKEASSYMHCLFVWLAYIKKNGCLEASDEVRIFIDPVSKEFLSSLIPWQHLIEDLPFTLTLTEVEKPATIQEGMSIRYAVASTLPADHSLYVYMDLDLLLLKPISSLPLPENYFFTFAEGPLEDGNYSGDATLFPSIDQDAIGVSSTCFGWNGAPPLEAFLLIAEATRAKDPPFSTIDQPFFNRFLHTIPNLQILDARFICTNEYYLEKPSVQMAIFANFCGEAGNGPMHFTKLLGFLCVDFSK